MPKKIEKRTTIRNAQQALSKALDIANKLIEGNKYGVRKIAGPSKPKRSGKIRKMSPSELKK